MSDGLVLAGMSQGAYAVTDVVHALAQERRAPRQKALELRGIVLHGARVTLRASAAKALGIRVVLTAGERDGAAPHMRRLAQVLQSQGVTARYVSLGDVGHFIPVNTAEPMAELIAWARGDEPGAGEER